MRFWATDLVRMIAQNESDSIDWMQYKRQVNECCKADWDREKIEIEREIGYQQKRDNREMREKEVGYQQKREQERRECEKDGNN